MLILKYTTKFETQLFSLIQSEGTEWEYWQPSHKANYTEALVNSETFVIFEGDVLVGYARTLNDYIIWIIDLLVHRDYRGKQYGKHLMEHVCAQNPTKDVYVLGGDDVLAYYNKLSYKPEGIVYKVN